MLLDEIGGLKMNWRMKTFGLNYKHLFEKGKDVQNMQ